MYCGNTEYVMHANIVAGIVVIPQVGALQRYIDRIKLGYATDGSLPRGF
ncbi:hypothetical protein AB7M49_004163 [Bradyrhizobium elkanii]